MTDDNGLFNQVRVHTRNFFTNWSNYDAPIPIKIALTAKNRVKALRHGCCGNDGQPGC